MSHFARMLYKLQEGINTINDASIHPMYKSNRLVIESPCIRFYIGQVIECDGYRLGTVCVIDTKPRNISQSEENILKICGSLVESEIHKMNYIKKVDQYTIDYKSISALISHELINSISPIISLSQCAINYPDMYDSEYNDIILYCAQNALKMSSALLDNFKIELEQFNLDKKWTSIQNVTKGFTFTSDYNEMIYIDELRIRQVLVNLMSNASDYGNGTEELHICKIEDSIAFIVSNTGIEIPIHTNRSLQSFQKTFPQK
jgi:signal transduction histidine kinase